MSDEVETVWIICVEWSEEQLLLLAGNRTAMCSVCSAPVVISVEGRELVAKYPLTARLICMDCAIKQMPDGIPEPAPGAVERAEREGYTLSPRTRAAMRRTPLREYGRGEMS